MLLLSFSIYLFVSLILFKQQVNALTVHETCKSMTGVDEYGYSPDVTDAVKIAYKYVKMVASNAAVVIENYRTNKLPPNERVRISSLLTAFGIVDGDKRQNLYLYQIEAAWQLLASNSLLDSTIIFCGTPEGPNQWQYVPKIPLGQNWVWRNYMTKPPFESDNKYRICQDPTHKGPHYSPGTWAFEAEQNVYLCAAGFQGLKVSGFPTSAQDRGDDYSKIKGENALEYWGRSLVGVLMHELHHAVGTYNVDVVIDKAFVPPGFPSSGQGDKKSSRAYGYAGIAALANWVQTDKSQAANTLTHNPDTIVYFAMAIWLSGNSWVDNVAKPLAGGVESNPADQQVAARRLIREAMQVPHLDNTGMMGTRFLS